MMVKVSVYLNRRVFVMMSEGTFAHVEAHLIILFIYLFIYLFIFFIYLFIDQ